MHNEQYKEQYMNPSKYLYRPAAWVANSHLGAWLTGRKTDHVLEPHDVESRAGIT